MLEMGIYNRLKVLIAEKEVRENRRLPYRTVSKEAGIPLSVLGDYTSQNAKRFDKLTLEKLCKYFGVQPGDLLVYSEDSPDQSKSPKRKNRPS